MHRLSKIYTQIKGKISKLLSYKIKDFLQDLNNFCPINFTCEFSSIPINFLDILTFQQPSGCHPYNTQRSLPTALGEKTNECRSDLVQSYSQEFRRINHSCDHLPTKPVEPQLSSKNRLQNSGMLQSNKRPQGSPYNSLQTKTQPSENSGQTKTPWPVNWYMTVP